MRFPMLSAALAALCFALPSTAQDATTIAVTGTRAETRILMFGGNGFALASLTHGQPEWKPEYDGKLDEVKGKMNRLGKDWWTTLITSSELEIGGTKIAPGSYVVGLHCDNDGKFALALLDSTKAMKDGVQFMGNWKPDFTVPLTLNKDSAKAVVSKLTMTFDAKEDSGGKGTFTLAWGKHTLTAPCQLHLPKK